MKMNSKLVYLGALTLVLGVGVGVQAADEAARVVEQAVVIEGTTEGVLVAKGDNWIEVKAENQTQALRFRAPWIGGLPKNGGGPDALVVKAIKALRVPNRVRVAWKTLEGPRVVGVETLETGDKSGQGFGIVTAKGENWIEIKSEGVTERYSPRWIGKMPKDGGGLDKLLLRAIGERRIGDKVRFEWLFDERPRVVVLQLDKRP